MATPIQTRAPFGAAFVLGFALSGFFDGVLLHQILQWHHLLSLVPDQRVQSLHVQVLADGLFHALMYLVAVVGVVLLWRQRRGLAGEGGSRRMWGGVLIGFGGWNVVDVALFHWILNIHHIRLDVSDPIAWDIGWLAVLGLAPLIAGLLVLRQGPRIGAPAASAAALLLLVLGTGGWNLRPPPRDADTLVLFRPGADVMAALVAADARLVQIDASGSIAVVRLPSRTAAWAFYRHGALMVQGAGPLRLLQLGARVTCVCGRSVQRVPG